MTGNADDTLYLARAGFRLFPVHGLRNGICTCMDGAECASPGKHPVFEKGFYRARRKLFGFFALWAPIDHPSNIGMRTGDGIAVVDIDIKYNGLESLIDLAEKYGKLPTTWTARTGSGGYHFYFRIRERIGNSVSKIAEGIDFRGDGGYVIAPGSRHHLSGGVYEWQKGFGPTDIEIADLPDWLRELAMKKPPPKAETFSFETPDGETLNSNNVIVANNPGAMARAIVRKICNDMANTGEGQRNSKLFKAAFRLGRLVAGGSVSLDATREMLHMAGLAAGLKEKEVAATANNGFKMGVTLPQYVLRPDQLNGVQTEQPAQAVAEPFIEEGLSERYESETDPAVPVRARAEDGIAPTTERLYNGVFRSSDGTLYFTEVTGGVARLSKSTTAIPKPSHRTVFIAPNQILKLIPPSDVDWAIHDCGDSIAIISKSNDGHWQAMHAEGTPITDEPAHGLIALQLDRPAREPPVSEGRTYSTCHFGKQIVEMHVCAQPCVRRMAAPDDELVLAAYLTPPSAVPEI